MMNISMNELIDADDNGFFSLIECTKKTKRNDKFLFSTGTILREILK